VSQFSFTCVCEINKYMMMMMMMMMMMI